MTTTNPAVTRLFSRVANPVMTDSLTFAVRSKQIISVENLPDELLAPAYLLAEVAREFGETLVDDFPLLRKRVDEDAPDDQETVVYDLLRGATFSGKAPVFPESARENCEPGEVRIAYLPIGSRVRLMGNGTSRLGTITDRSPSRAVVLWEGTKSETSITNRRTGKTVTFESDGAKVTGCALDCPVIPILSVVATVDADWVTNAFKELRGVFAGEDLSITDAQRARVQRKKARAK